MWAGAASSLPRADSGVDGGSGGRLPALEPGSLRLQLAGGHRLGGRVAWDRANGLLAAELQAEEGAGTIPVAILDPQAPEVRGADRTCVGFSKLPPLGLLRQQVHCPPHPWVARSMR